MDTRTACVNSFKVIYVLKKDQRAALIILKILKYFEFFYDNFD